MLNTASANFDDAKILRSGGCCPELKATTARIIQEIFTDKKIDIPKGTIYQIFTHNEANLVNKRLEGKPLSPAEKKDAERLIDILLKKYD